MDKHKVTRESDEYVCTCGLRWDTHEEDPHEQDEEESDERTDRL